MKVEVPVLVDTTGRTWALPSCRSLTGADLAPGSLVESPALDPTSAEVAAPVAIAAAQGRPGRHDVALAVTVDPALSAAPDDSPAVSPLGGWALSEELLAIDLSVVGDGEPPAASGHAIEARLFAAEAPEGAPVVHLRPAARSRDSGRRPCPRGRCHRLRRCPAHHRPRS